MPANAMSPIETSDLDHVALCGWALSRAVDALKRADAKSAVASLREVELEAGCARVALLGDQTEGEELGPADLTVSSAPEASPDGNAPDPTPRRRKADQPGYERSLSAPENRLTRQELGRDQAGHSRVKTLENGEVLGEQRRDGDSEVPG